MAAGMPAPAGIGLKSLVALWAKLAACSTEGALASAPWQHTVVHLPHHGLLPPSIFRGSDNNPWLPLMLRKWHIPTMLAAWARA